MLRIVVILVILAVAAVAMVVWAQRRDISDLSSQETDSRPPVRDRPAGPEAETMDPDELGGHRTR